ncbi:MAG: LD-carboxypeptidase [Polyangiaceae bacterium]|nr:LD-carboxypeptidase [Polyangiaceae bacterium]
MKVPRALCPGDRVRVIAPSSPFDRTLVLRGMGWLGQRYRVEFEPGLFDATGFLAGSDERRLRELDAALRSDAAAIIVARGGYGLTRIAGRVDWSALAARPKWMVGFSDATVLHVEAARQGLASLHASAVAGLGRGDAHARQRWLQALEQPRCHRVFGGLETLAPGQASGPLAGGNLTLLLMCSAARRLALPAGCILVLEETGESSYRIDRMLTALTQAGELDHVRGVAVGDLTDCSDGRYGVPPLQVVAERLAALRVPMVAGLPIGHGRHNHPIALGITATLDASGGTLSFGG